MRTVFLVGAASLLIAGCARSPEYPSEEVLRRSAAASQTLASSTFKGEGSVHLSNDTSSQTYTLGVQGVLQDAGHQTQITATVNGDIRAADQKFAVSGLLDVISLGRSEVYLRVQNVKSTPEFPLLSSDLLKDFVGQWWLLTATGAVASEQDALSPDPSLLRLQSEVVKVTQDHGIQHHDGHDVYVYDVQISQEGFEQFLKRLAPSSKSASGQTMQFVRDYDATGRLEIDAENFYVRKVTWNLQPKPGTAQRMSADFSLTFADQNAAPRIQAPEGAKPFHSPLATGIAPITSRGANVSSSSPK